MIDSPQKKYNLGFETKYLLFLFFLSFFATNSTAQDQVNYMHGAYAEKIYLQLDRQHYLNTETIWFKAIVAHAIDHKPTVLSRVLYVDLIGPDKEIVDQKIIQLEAGKGEGFFALNESLIQGGYAVRAYTQWNKNFDQDFFFQTNIKIYSEATNKDLTSVIEAEFIRQAKGYKKIKVDFDVSQLDTLPQKKLKVFLFLDEKEDSLLLEKNKENQFELNFLLSDTVRLFTVKMQTKNGATHLKTFSFNGDPLDLQFFPESGSLVHGLSTKVGFKVLNTLGKGALIIGEILDQNGKVVSYFKSNRLGMGSFALINVDKETSYFAKITGGPLKNESRLFPLPKVEPKGNIMLLDNQSNAIKVRVFSNYLQSDNVTVQIACRGKQYYNIESNLNDGKLDLLVPSQKLPLGVIAFTLLDKDQKILAERLIFNENKEGYLPLELSTSQMTYQQREETKLDIQLPSGLDTIEGVNLSVLVINKAQLGDLQYKRDHILSYFLLNSDLKGNIESPQFYFENRPDRLRDLDALLLTQGWRKYLYTQAPKELPYLAETKLTVSGKIIGLPKKREKELDLTLVAFSEPNEVQTQTIDNSGKFYFELADQYGFPLRVLLQSKNLAGQKQNINILLNNSSTPKIDLQFPKTSGKIDSIAGAFLKKSMERKEIDEAFSFSGVIDLNEVLVEDYELTPAKKEVRNLYGKPDLIINGKDLLAKEQKWSTGLYDVLSFGYPKEFRVSRGSNGIRRIRVYNNDKALVVVDGIPVRDDDYLLIPQIRVKEISSIEVIKNSQNFFRLYLDHLSRAPLISPPVFGDIIAIYTYSGKGLYGTNQRLNGLLYLDVPVFQPKREFYAPKYPNLQPEDLEKPDYRALVHWEPNLNLDSEGKAEVRFFNADNRGEMLVILEAIATDGRINYQELNYEVVRRRQ